MGAEVISLFNRPETEAVMLPSMGRITRIQNLVANSYGVPRPLMRSKSRMRSAAWPRQVAMYLCRDVFGLSLAKIGREFGNRDHTTVIHAIAAVQKRMAADTIYKADVEALRAVLR